MGCHLSTAYEWIHRLNASEFTTFEGAQSQGTPAHHHRPPDPRSSIIALSSPGERGLPFSAWTMLKLAVYCRQPGLLPPITDEWVRRLLRREGLRAQRTST
jgi:hypothetical protein